MSAPAPAHAAHRRPVRPATVIAATLLLAAVALPVAATAAWLDGTYTATPQNLATGVLILKGCLVALAIAVLVTAAANPAGDDRATTDVVAPDGLGTLLLVAILVVATVLRLHRLGTELWLDEIDSFARYISLRATQIVSTYDTQNQHPLYSLLARAAYVSFGHAEWAIRLPAVAFGVASLWATSAFARRYASRAETLLAVLLLAVSYHHVWFSQNARGYTAILFFAIVGTGLFVRLVEGAARPALLAWGYAVAMAMATWAHATAALIVVGHAVALLVLLALRRRGTPRVAAAWPLAAVALSGLVAITLYAVVLPQLLLELTKPTLEGVTIVWTSPLWMLRETLRVLGQGVPGGIIVAGAGVFVLGVGVASYWRQSRIVVLATLTPVVVTAASVIALHHNLWPRFFFFAAAFFVLFAMRGGFAIVRTIMPRHGERVAIAGALAVAGLSALTVPRAWQPKQQFLAAAAWVESQRQPGDAVIAPDVAEYIYLMYHTPADWHLTTVSENVEHVERTAQRTWVVYTYPTRLEALYPAVAAHFMSAPYREVRVFSSTVGGAEIHVALRDSP